MLTLLGFQLWNIWRRLIVPLCLFAKLLNWYYEEEGVDPFRVSTLADLSSAQAPQNASAFFGTTEDCRDCAWKYRVRITPYEMTDKAHIQGVLENHSFGAPNGNHTNQEEHQVVIADFTSCDIETLSSALILYSSRSLQHSHKHTISSYLTSPDEGSVTSWLQGKVIAIAKRSPFGERFIVPGTCSIIHPTSSLHFNEVSYSSSIMTFGLTKNEQIANESKMLPTLAVLQNEASISVREVTKADGATLCMEERDEKERSNATYRYPLQKVSQVNGTVACFDLKGWSTLEWNSTKELTAPLLNSVQNAQDSHNSQNQVLIVAEKRKRRNYLGFSISGQAGLGYSDEVRLYEERECSDLSDINSGSWHTIPINSGWTWIPFSGHQIHTVVVMDATSTVGVACGVFKFDHSPPHEFRPPDLVNILPHTYLLNLLPLLAGCLVAKMFYGTKKP